MNYNSQADECKEREGAGKEGGMEGCREGERKVKRGAAVTFKAAPLSGRPSAQTDWLRDLEPFETGTTGRSSHP